VCIKEGKGGMRYGLRRRGSEYLPTSKAKKKGATMPALGRPSLGGEKGRTFALGELRPTSAYEIKVYSDGSISGG